MTVTERYGADLFRSANACVMLDESTRFTPIYAPIMERCLRSECISDDVDLINNHVMGTSRKADSLFDARVIAFRNKVLLQYIPYDSCSMTLVSPRSTSPA